MEEISIERETVELGTAYMEQVHAFREGTSRKHDISREQEILLAVEHGDPERVRELTDAYCPVRALQLAELDLAEWRNGCVYVITLGAWAAVRGGVRQEEAFAYQNMLYQRLGKLTRVEDIVELRRTVCEEFAHFVRERGERERDPLVQRAKDYVADHLHSGIRAEKMAAELGCPQKALSAAFRRTEGCTIAEYVRRERARLWSSSTTGMRWPRALSPPSSPTAPAPPCTFRRTANGSGTTSRVPSWPPSTVDTSTFSRTDRKSVV